MMRMFRPVARAAAATALGLAVAAAANAAIVVSKISASVTLIPGLTGFTTSGNQLDGLLVSASFSGGVAETRAWADTGVGSGGVTGTGWSLTQSGDTFNQSWQFSFLSGTALGSLLSLTLDASAPGQVTIFDTTSPSPGSSGSAQGLDFVIAAGCAGCNGTAIYTNAVGIVPNAPVGDLFHTLTVTFTGGSGPSSNFQFLQDADNDVRAITGFLPEPSSIALAGLALMGLGMARQRRAHSAAAHPPM